MAAFGVHQPAADALAELRGVVVAVLGDGVHHGGVEDLVLLAGDRQGAVDVAGHAAAVDHLAGHVRASRTAGAVGTGGTGPPVQVRPQRQGPEHAATASRVGGLRHRRVPEAGLSRPVTTRLQPLQRRRDRRLRDQRHPARRARLPLLAQAAPVEVAGDVAGVPRRLDEVPPHVADRRPARRGHVPLELPVRHVRGDGVQRPVAGQAGDVVQRRPVHVHLERVADRGRPGRVVGGDEHPRPVDPHLPGRVRDDGEHRRRRRRDAPGHRHALSHGRPPRCRGTAPAPRPRRPGSGSPGSPPASPSGPRRKCHSLADSRKTTKCPSLLPPLHVHRVVPAAGLVAVELDVQRGQHVAGAGADEVLVPAGDHAGDLLAAGPHRVGRRRVDAVLGPQRRGRLGSPTSTAGPYRVASWAISCAVLQLAQPPGQRGHLGAESSGRSRRGHELVPGAEEVRRVDGEAAGDAALAASPAPPSPRRTPAPGRGPPPPTPARRRPTSAAG